LLLEFLLPFSYNHLLFKLTLDRFPVAGVGVAGPSPNTLDAVLALSGLGEPNDDVRAAPFPATALCSKGLAADGEYCEVLNCLEGESCCLEDEYGVGLGLARGELA
jgi:hypothetical protein